MDQRQEDRLSRVERLTLRMSVIQTAIAVTGFFVAIIALYAALNEADAVRKQQQASVWPHLEFHRSYRSVPGDETLSITLRNSGIGPARIESIEFSRGDVPLRSWGEFVETFTDEPNPLFSHVGVSGRVIRPEQGVALFSVTAAEMSSEAIESMRDAIDEQHVTGQVCYCSVFEECWTLHSREPVPIDHCPPSRQDSTL